MGEKSAPVPKVICVRLRFSRLYFQMLVSPLTVRLKSTDLPGSAHAMLELAGFSPNSTASWLATLILNIRSFDRFGLPARASRSLPPGNSRTGTKNRSVRSGLYTNSSFTPDVPTRKSAALADFTKNSEVPSDDGNTKPADATRRGLPPSAGTAQISSRPRFLP